MIRPARATDRGAVEAIVQEAYSIYIQRIGKPPGPMLDDYARRIADGASVSSRRANGGVAGLIVLVPKADHLLLDNIVVRPDRQRQGLGRVLIASAEAEARRMGFAELQLYTHEAMRENIALYKRFGFEETGRRQEAGYDRVFMRKSVNNFP